MIATRKNIALECGADFVMLHPVTDENGDPKDLTGATIEAQLRHFAQDTEYYLFTTYHNGAGGRITMAMPHELTAEISYVDGVYDVFVNYPDGGREKVLYGNAHIEPHVVKPVDGTVLYMIGIGEYTDLPLAGEVDRLYFVYDDRKIYRWNGTNYISTSVGNGIQKIEKIGTAGLIDTYRITYDDGTSFDYMVVNGKGVSSVTHVDGGTYRMNFNDGTYVDFDSVPRVLGTYDATTAYEKLDIVHGTDGATYIAKIPVPAGTALSNATYWQQMTPKVFQAVNVTTVGATSDASASIGGTADAPVLNLSIPRGAAGNESIDDTKGKGYTDYVWSADKLYNQFDNLDYINLVPTAYKDGKRKVNNGLTYTVEDDGSITINGTQTAYSYFTIIGASTKIPIDAGVYTLHGGFSETYPGAFLQVNIDGTNYTYRNTPINITVNSPTTFGMSIGMDLVSTPRVNFKIYPMLEKGLIAHAYKAPSIIENAKDQQELKTTVSEKVYVLDNDTKYGDRTVSPVLFEKRLGEDTAGFKRNDNSYIYPVITNLKSIKPSPVPEQDLMTVVKSWLYRCDQLRHGESSEAARWYTLFGETCEAAQDGKYITDCTTIIESFLLGITFDRSRYVLGTDADNIKSDIVMDKNWPETYYTSLVPKGGLQISELMVYYIEHGCAYMISKDIEDPASLLQMGDILARRSDDTPDNMFRKISHVQFVLGVLPGTQKVWIVESSGYNPSGYENSDIHEDIIDFKSVVDNNGCEIIIRPDYNCKGSLQKSNVIPCAGGYYQQCKFIPHSNIITDISDNDESYFEVAKHYGATPDYYSIMPGSTIEYTGQTYNDRDNYKFDVIEYDQYYAYLSRTTILENRETIALQTSANTRFVRFVLHHQNKNSTIGIVLKDCDDVEIRISHP